MAKKSGAKRLGGKFSEFVQMSREDKQRALYTLLLNNAMYIIIAAAVIFIAVRVPAFLSLSSIINVVLDFFLILVCKMGVAGAGWATVTSQLISGLTCLIYMYKKYDILKGDKSERILDRRFITNLCMNGVPMGLQYSITAIGSTILQAAVNTLGSTYVAAMTAGSKMFNFTCCPFDAHSATPCGGRPQNSFTSDPRSQLCR